MKFKETKVVTSKEILANDDWAGMPFSLPNSSTNVLKAGDIIEGKGVNLYDVDPKVNPNGTYIYRGTIDMRRLETSQRPTAAQVAAFPQIIWLNADNTKYTGA